MSNGRNLKDLQVEAEKVGFKYQNMLVWKKQNATPNKWYMQQCEFILMLRKGRAKNINHLGTKNCFEIPNILGKGKDNHPTEKPVDLMKILIENSSQPNEIVLDPFAGSGSTLVACKQLGRQYIGFEIDLDYFNLAYRNLHIEKAQTEALI